MQKETKIVKIEVFTSPTCPYCPATLRMLQKAVSLYENFIEIAQIDVTVADEQDLIAFYKVQTTPTIVINSNVSFRGPPSSEAVLFENIEKNLDKDIINKVRRRKPTQKHESKRTDAKIVITKKAKEAIEEEIELFLGLEDNNLQISDIGLILFVRKQSCSPMTEGGHREVGVGVESIQNYRNNPKYIKIETLKEVHNIPVYIENEAHNMLNDRDIVEIDSRGVLEKELLIRDGPVIDLGACKVPNNKK